MYPPTRDRTGPGDLQQSGRGGYPGENGDLQRASLLRRDSQHQPNSGGGSSQDWDDAESKSPQLVRLTMMVLKGIEKRANKVRNLPGSSLEGFGSSSSGKDMVRNIRSSHY